MHMCDKMVGNHNSGRKKSENSDYYRMGKKTFYIKQKKINKVFGLTTQSLHGLNVTMVKPGKKRYVSLCTGMLKTGKKEVFGSV